LTRVHIAYTGTAPNDATCATLAQALWVIFGAEFCTYAGSDVSLTSVTLTDLTSPTSGQGDHIATTVGVLAGTMIGADVCMLASMRIARRYRGGKPRSYLPLGTTNVLQTAQTWAATFVSNVQLALDATRADIAVTVASGTTLTTLVNVSYYQGFTVVTNPVTGRARNVPKLRVGGPVVDVVTNWVAESRLASQRRRNLRSS
jgi:hypothetical protein